MSSSKIGALFQMSTKVISKQDGHQIGDELPGKNELQSDAEVNSLHSMKFALKIGNMNAAPGTQRKKRKTL